MPYCITHNDLDGLGCAILLEKVFPRYSNLYYRLQRA